MKALFSVPKKVHHGLLLVTELAGRYGSGQPMTLDELAVKTGISQGFLEEVAASLRSAGIIAGRRGAGGGYELKKDPRRLTVAEVLEAYVGPLAMIECLDGRTECLLAESCSNRNVWLKVQNQVAATLRRLTVAEAGGLTGRRRQAHAKPIAKK